jgi:hypothetical protein
MVPRLNLSYIPTYIHMLGDIHFGLSFLTYVDTRKSRSQSYDFWIYNFNASVESRLVRF